jgi:hypothetical protein
MLNNPRCTCKHRKRRESTVREGSHFVDRHETDDEWFIRTRPRPLRAESTISDIVSLRVRSYFTVVLSLLARTTFFMINRRD